MIYGTATIIGRFLSFMLYPLYSNFITKSEIGNISNIFAIIAFINILYTFGMESAFFRFYKKDDLQYSKNVYSHSFIAMFVIGAIFSISIFFLAPQIAPIIADSSADADLIRIAAFIPFLDTLIVVPYALLRMTRQAKRFALTRLSLIVFAVIMNLILVAILQMGIYGVFIANLISNIAGIAIFSKSIFSFLIPKLDLPLLKQMLRFGLPTIPASFSAIVLQVADKPIIKAILGSEQLGLYSVNYKLGIPMMLAVSVFDYAWKPFYLSHYQEEGAKALFARVLTYFTLICALMFLFISFFIEFIVMVPFIGGRLINPDYWSGLSIVPIILAAYYFNGVFSNIASGFNITKRTEYLPISVGFAALISIIINIIFLPVFGIYVAPWATFIAYFSSALILYIFQHKIYHVKYEWSRLFTIYIVTIILYITVSYITHTLNFWLSITIKAVAFSSFIFILFLSGFFKRSEIDELAKIFRKSS